MIDHVTLLDWLAIGACLAVFGIAIGVICYWSGRSHAYEQGYKEGCERIRRQLTPRIMRAKVDGQRAGRLLGMREAIKLCHATPAAAGEAGVKVEGKIAGQEPLTSFIIL